ncbi:hypothetical protein Prudu_921S000100, partial [Prunus dulcis]
LLLSPPAATLRDLPPSRRRRPPRLELISETVPNEPAHDGRHFLYPPPPLPWSESAGICHGSRRFVNATRTSSSNISLISSPNLSSTEVQSACRRDRQGVEVVEVHRIHHRATLNLHASSQVKFWDWSKYRGDSAEFSAEV